MSVNIEVLLTTLEHGIEALAAKDLQDYALQATADGKALLKELKDDIKSWANAFAEGNITKDELEDLVLGQKDLIELVGLKQVGLAQIKADQFKSDVLNLIKTTIQKLI